VAEWVRDQLPHLPPDEATAEFEVQIELEAEFFRNGGDFLAFDSIIGGGPNSAVLHFPPTSRRFRDGELVLVDAGAEYRGYASDITRTYPVSGTFTPEQAELHTLVPPSYCSPSSGGRAKASLSAMHRSSR
jgi:Xaa-Pro aminopeptidase